MTPNDMRNELEPLLARCASGEAAALKLLYKNTAAQLFGVLRRILLRDDLAQEALQDVYVSVWRNARLAVHVAREHRAQPCVRHQAQPPPRGAVR
jgi:DNA-directed RNA polymerase specialized sigma24 family protein